MTELSDLRKSIDAIDAAIVGLLAERMQVCRDVAELKEHTGAAVIQPQRVRDVLATRRQWAIDAGVDADFAEQLFRPQSFSHCLFAFIISLSGMFRRSSRTTYDADLQSANQLPVQWRPTVEDFKSSSSAFGMEYPEKLISCTVNIVLTSSRSLYS
jgi:chorismate mutase-like protein